MKPGFRGLRSEALKHDFKLVKTDAGIYQLHKLGDYGTTFSGTLEEVRIWMLGYSFYKTHTEHHYHLLVKL